MNTTPEELPFTAYRVAASRVELRPLLRASSPLQRIVKARGL